MRHALSLSVAFVAAIAASASMAAQPVIVGPYPLLKKIVYDVDYAVSTTTPGTAAPSAGSETIISIGLPTNGAATGAQCQAQVDWFDWDGFPAGLSGPSPAGSVPTLLPGHTLEFTTSLNSATPQEFPPFTENVFRDTTKPAGSKIAFEGHAQVRVLCPSGVASPKLRVDAEVVRFETDANGKLKYKYKPINVTRTAGLSGY
jgi:hypothetical protein